MSETKQAFTRTNNRITQKKKGRKKILLYIGIPTLIILLTTLSYGGYLYTTAQKAVDDSFEGIGRENETSLLRDQAVDPMKDNVSVLIIGVDDSERRNYNGNSRSDALILATFNKKEEDVKLLSIPRDSYVYIPEVDYSTKINHAHAFGGPKASIDAVENFLNVPVDYYVRLNFEAFIEVIDSIGGIHYDVPFEISEMNSKDKKNAIHLSPGYQKLTGEEALALARTRKYDNDFERGKRQQEIIKTIVKETASASSLFKLDDLIDAVGSNMTTNLSFNEMKSFVAYGLKKKVAMESVTLDGEGGKMNDGIWYYHVDEESREKVQQELRNQLGLPKLHSDDTELSTGDNKQNKYSPN